MNRDIRRFLRKGQKMPAVGERHWETLPIKVRFTPEPNITDNADGKPRQIELGLDIDEHSEFIINLSVQEAAVLADILRIRVTEIAEGKHKMDVKRPPLILRS